MVTVDRRVVVVVVFAWSLCSDRRTIEGAVVGCSSANCFAAAAAAARY